MFLNRNLLFILTLLFILLPSPPKSPQGQLIGSIYLLTKIAFMVFPLKNVTLNYYPIEVQQL